MNLFAFSGLLIAATSVFFGYFVYSRDKTRDLYRRWFLYTTGVGLWGLGGFGASIAKTPEHALLAWRIALGAGVIWIPVLFYHFFCVYTDRRETRGLILAYGVGAFFFFANFTPYLVASVRPVFNSFYYLVPAYPLFHFFTLWWFGLTVYTHLKLFLISRRLPQVVQNQVHYFLIASVIGYGGGLLDFFPVFGIDIYPYSNFLVALYPIIMAYAIVKHNLFNIVFIIRRTLVYAIIIALISWGIAAAGFFNTLLVQRIPGFQPWIIPFSAGILAFYTGRFYLKKSRETDRLQYEFLTVAAHKLRTPLTHIRYLTEELASREIQDDALEILRSLRQSNDQLIGLTNKLLEAASVEKKGILQKVAPVHLQKLIEDALVELAPLIKERRVNIIFQPPRQTLLVHGDRKNLYFVVQTLIENAIFYTPPAGEAYITLLREKKRVVFSIKDTGIGIPREEQEYIFEKFFRGQKAMTVETEGTGLGLFVAKNIIRRHRGSIHVESAGPGKGSRFWFTLPAVMEMD